ncbi:MAG TPA: BPSS1780 family membrane protein [Burkholderiales bacterium]|nr:BPSS1780 family membrane protein [Burkholderiales bacterium]
MRANRLPAARGLRWVAEAFLIFRVAPLRQLLLNLLFLFAITIVVAVPVIGFAAVWLLFPALAVGPHAISRMAARGTAPGADLLVSGFRRNLAAQLRLGGFFLAAMLAVLAATALADDGRFAQAMIGRIRLDIADLQDPELQRAMLVGAALQTVLLGLLWYAPLLVAWEGLAASKAVFFSAAATLINWRALIAYASAVMLLFAFVLMLALGGALLFGGGAAQANSALFAVVWTLLPVWFASSYLSYRDLFGTDESAKSPTIPS